LANLRPKVSDFKTRRGITGMVAAIIGAGILLVVFAIIIGSLLPTGLGTIANGSLGSKMVNVDSGSKALYNNINLLVIVVVIVLLVGVILATLHKSGKI